ncbi:MAG TPA: hypothetical protein VM243_21500 [Phycisphaerae bacterium]|nr:hypothetical protein [Phycisphaerae bacterium]
MPYIDPAECKRRVRSTALWAGLAAVIMLFFGYRGGWELPEANPMRAGSMLFVYTLKIGGWVMLVEALLLWTGIRAALVCDGVVTTLIGMLLVLGGLLMTPGSLWQALLFIVFGLLFISSGLRSWREGRALFETSAPAPAGDGLPPADAAATEAAAGGADSQPEASEGHLSQFADEKRPADER